MTPDRGPTVHGTCVVLGESAVLITGVSGIGKSRLARRLMALVAESGGHAALVGDDRVHLRARNGRLLARGHATVQGLMEMRGIGIVPVPHATAAVVGLVAHLGEEAAPRLPEPDARTRLGDLPVPILHLDARLPAEDNARLVLARLVPGHRDLAPPVGTIPDFS